MALEGRKRSMVEFGGALVLLTVAFVVNAPCGAAPPEPPTMTLKETLGRTLPKVAERATAENALAYGRKHPGYGLATQCGLKMEPEVCILYPAHDDKPVLAVRCDRTDGGNCVPERRKK